MVFQGTVERLRQKIPAGYGTLTPTATGVLFESQHGDLASTARYLTSLNVPFVIHHPPELRAEPRQMAERMPRCATDPGAPAVQANGAPGQG